jgi:glycine cleavage system H protein
MSMNVPPELRYAKSHEWVRLEGNTATVGITDHAQHELTDIVFVELPALGRQLVAGEPCAVVESVKTASDVYSPLSGEVVAANQAVIDNPALANSDPYGAGWFYRLRVAKPSELATLLTPEGYRELIGAS